MGKSLKSNVKHQLWMPSRAANMPSAVVASLHTMPSKHRCSHLYLLLRRKKPLQWSPKWQYRMICADKEEKWSKPEAKTLPSGVFFCKVLCTNSSFHTTATFPLCVSMSLSLYAGLSLKWRHNHTLVSSTQQRRPCATHHVTKIKRCTANRHATNIVWHNTGCDVKIFIRHRRDKQWKHVHPPPTPPKKKNKANEIQLSIKCACTCQSLPHRTASSFLN